MALADVLFAVLLATPITAPPAGMTEDRPALEARLRSIADDAAAVANDDPEMATLILAVAQHESGFALDVDKGPCRAGTCDGGQAACLMQIWTFGDEKKKAALFADRRLCFSTGLAALKSSMGMCGKLGPELQFSAYAGGTCESGHEGSKQLYSYWLAFRSRWAMADAEAKKSR